MILGFDFLRISGVITVTVILWKPDGPVDNTSALRCVS